MSPLFSQFDRIYIINLSERTDRRRQILMQLRRIGLDLESGRVELFPAIATTEAAGFPNAGVRGCFLSHLEVLERAETDNLEAALVLEDDLVFSQRFDDDVGRLMAHMQGVEWHMAYLGHRESIQSDSPLAIAPPDLGIICAHFYAVRRPMRRELISFLREVLRREPGSPLGGPMHVDGAFSFFRARHPEFLTILVQPSLGYQGSSRSDITPSWHDRIGLLRPVTSLARNVLRRIK